MQKQYGSWSMQVLHNHVRALGGTPKQDSREPGLFSENLTFFGNLVSCKEANIRGCFTKVKCGVFGSCASKPCLFGIKEQLSANLLVEHGPFGRYEFTTDKGMMRFNL